jgi:hypothetical protein
VSGFFSTQKIDLKTNNTRTKKDKNSDVNDILLKDGRPVRKVIKYEVLLDQMKPDSDTDISPIRGTTKSSKFIRTETLSSAHGKRLFNNAKIPDTY